MWKLFARIYAKQLCIYTVGISFPVLYHHVQIDHVNTDAVDKKDDAQRWYSGTLSCPGIFGAILKARSLNFEK